uniref:response regulator receiver domain n=1 Tax=Fulvivirga sp. TaxID=1931237 RepID=UPI00404A58C6
MTNTAYLEKAFYIIRSSIKSAVFIDENALDFYSEEAPSGEYEEELSKELFKNFKLNGISLAVHKFNNGDQDDEVLKEYLFDKRDLVLLDWNLDNQEGADLSLKMISDIVKKPNIHFCVIYTSSPNIANVFNQISCYFSGKTQEELDELKSSLEAYEDDLKPILDKIEGFKEFSDGTIIAELVKIDKQLPKEIKNNCNETDIFKALKIVKYAFGDFYKAPENLPVPTVFSFSTQTLVIRNTIITILKKEKEQNASSNSELLIRKLSDQLANGENSFTQLLGFEMQSLFARSSSFVDANLLKVSKEALFSHRNQMYKKEGDDTQYKLLIKNLLIEHASISLRNSKLSLLMDDFLKEQSEALKAPSPEELISMNVFYNSVEVKNSEDGNVKTLNFGDVFFDEKNTYYICITALCDCYRPSKIKNNYYFAIGHELLPSEALDMGDSAFISYLPNGKVISWVQPELFDSGDHNAQEEDIQDEEGLKIKIENLKLINRQLNQFRYKPVYIKPAQFNVKNHKLVNDQLELYRVEHSEQKGQDLNIFSVNYITSIRPNYTQRIANHAFGHPVRVGVDFVKK